MTLVLVTASCSDGGGASAPASSTATTVAVAPTTLVTDLGTTTVAPASQADWTVIVYLAADNDLENASLIDAGEMLAGLSARINLIVVHDRSPLSEGDGRPGQFTAASLGALGDWSGTRAYQVTPAGYVDLGISSDANMTDSAVYEALTAQVWQQFPANHQALFFWSHGAAWRGAMMDDSSDPGAILSTDDLADAVGRALVTVGDDRVDLAVYDSCLMGELSAASAFADVADFLLASQEVVPAHGLDYTALATAAQATNGADFGAAMLAGFMSQATDLGTVDTVTMSLIDLAGAAELDAAFADLVAATRTLSGADAVTMMRAVQRTLSFGGGQFLMADLGQYVNVATTSDPVVNAALQRISNAVDAMVIDHDEGAPYEGATGLAAYLPPTINEFDPAYSEVGGLSAQWGQFLNGLFNAGADAVNATPVEFSTPTQALWADQDLAIVAQVDPAVATGLVERTAYLGLDSEEGVIVLYSSPVPEVDDEGTIGGRFSAAAWGLSTADGSAIHLVTLSETGTDVTELLVGVVPLLYTHPNGEQIEVWMIVSIPADAPEGTTPTLQLVALQENGSVGPFESDPSGTLDAWLGTYQADGSAVVRSNTELFGVAPLPADLSQLVIVPVPIEPGAVELSGVPLVGGIRIVDAAGRSALTWSRLA